MISNKKVSIKSGTFFWPLVCNTKCRYLFKRLISMIKPNEIIFYNFILQVKFALLGIFFLDSLIGLNNG